MSHSDQKIAIVGAGFTGLTAAYELAKAGYTVEVYEAAPVVGGLVAGFTLKDGQPLEKAYHFLYTTDNYMIDMAKELAIDTKLHFYQSSITAFYEGKRYGLTTPIDLLTFTPLSLINRIRTGLTGLRLMFVKKWQPLTKITAYEWLCKVNGKKATDIIWKPLLIGKFDVYWDKITMAWLWTRIHVRQTSRKKGEQNERLGYFDGGFQLMVQRWIEELEKRNVTIHTNTAISAFGENNSKPTLTVSGQTKAYDAILAATPSNVFAKLAAEHPEMTNDYSRQLTDIDYLGAVLVVFTTTKPITDTYWHQIHDVDAPFLVMLSLDSLIGTKKTNGKYIYYIGDYTQNDSELMQKSDNDIKQQWFEAVGELFPDFSNDIVDEVHVFKFKNAQHIVDTTYEDRIPSLRTPLPGFYLANFSQIFPEDRGTNYAVRDGLKVAKMIRDDL